MSNSVRPHRWQPTRLPILGILQARTLEWVAISFSNAWKWKVKGKSLSRVGLLATPWTAAYQAPPSMGFSRQEYRSGVPLTVFSCIKYICVSISERFCYIQSSRLTDPLSTMKISFPIHRGSTDTIEKSEVVFFVFCFPLMAYLPFIYYFFTKMYLSWTYF